MKPSSAASCVAARSWRTCQGPDIYIHTYIYIYIYIYIQIYVCIYEPQFCG